MIKRVLEEIKDIHSVSEKEGRLLQSLAQQCTGKGVIVEIGSWKGYSTIWLASGTLRGSKAPIYAVDPHTGSAVHHQMYGQVNTYEEFLSNITRAEVDTVVVPVVATSIKAESIWTRVPVELLWIDGDHEAADLDFNLWFPHLMDGGTIAMHDTTTWQVPHRVAMEKIYRSGNFTDIKRVGSITYAVKVAELYLPELRQNKRAYYRRCAYQTVLPYYNRVLGLAARLLGR